MPQPSRAAQPAGPGPPGTVVAVDLGGTYTKIGLATPDGDLSQLEEINTARDADDVVPVPWLVEQVRQRAEASGSLGFGVAVPGVVDRGRVKVATNIGWQHLDLADALVDGVGLPGRIGHDVRSGGLAEWRLGSGVGLENFCFLPLGTGIAAAFVCDGRMLIGDGYAGEVGHCRVAAAGELACACGQTGCLEMVSSAAGVRRTYARLDKIRLPEAPTTHVISRLARRGEATALAAFDLAALGLAQIVPHLVTLLAPQRISIGGGLAGSYDLLAPRIDQALDALTLMQRRPEVVKATLGSNAGLVGAGLLGWDATYQDLGQQGRAGTLGDDQALGQEETR